MLSPFASYAFERLMGYVHKGHVRLYLRQVTPSRALSSVAGEVLVRQGPYGRSTGWVGVGNIHYVWPKCYTLGGAEHPLLMPLSYAQPPLAGVLGPTDNCVGSIRFLAAPQDGP
jgi:hypothetical protein